MGTTVAIAKAVVVGCIDPRVQKALDEFRRAHDLNGGTSAPLHIHAPSLNIAEIFKPIDLAVEKLGPSEIHVVDHDEPECAGYVAVYRENYPKRLHQRHLRVTRQVLCDRYPGLNVRIHILRSDGSHEEILD